MDRDSERGYTIVEAAVAVALATVVGGACLNAAVSAMHAAANRSIREALESEVRREMPVAVDVLKYQGGSIVPTAVQTTLPMPAGTPLPARVTIGVSPDPAGAIRIAITAESVESRQRAEFVTTLGSQAPRPGAVVTAPGLAPAPTGAP